MPQSRWPALVIHAGRIGCDDLVAVSDDLCRNEMWLVTHPEYRRDPNVRAVAEFLRAAADGPTGLC